jgi:hypothetical protein
VTDFGFAFSQQQPKKKPSKLEAGQLYIDAGRVCYRARQPNPAAAIAEAAIGTFFSLGWSLCGSVLASFHFLTGKHSCRHLAVLSLFHSLVCVCVCAILSAGARARSLQTQMELFGLKRAR